MTDKEQIIIDNYFNIIKDDMGRAIGIQEISDPRELIKAIREQNEQLTRKTQECEELKQYQEDAEKILKNILDNFDKMENRYRKALEEIEAATKINCEEICGRKFEDCNDTSCFSAELLDIINKAKGERNEICTCARNTIS